MPRSAFAGTRIRERRMALGLRQSEVARRAGISGSYLNLIEHNRRRIGGKLLLDLAVVLKTDSASLAKGAASQMLNALRDAATEQPNANIDLKRTEDFADRFTDWAELILTQQSQIFALQQTIGCLSDRLAHDPFLSEALHEVLSTVSAIRSTASILAEPGKMDQNWQKRFQANVFQDSIRLATASQSLADYLDADADQVFSALSPLDELEALLLKNNYHFPHLEDLAVWSDTVVDAILINASLAAQKLGYTYFKQYWDDVQRFALPKLLKMVAKWGLDPARMASETQLPLPVIFRRLASLPSHKNRPPVGLMTCDGSGSLLRKQPSIGFQAPRVGSACALWPLYSSLTQIGVPLRQHVEYQARPGDSRDRAFYETFSIAERVAPSNFEDPAVVRSTMLIIPAQLVPTPPLITLGSTCRLCSVQACLARSEPSIFTDGF